MKAPVPTNIKHCLGQQDSQEIWQQFIYSAMGQIPNTLGIVWYMWQKLTFLVLIAQSRRGLWMVPSLNSPVFSAKGTFCAVVSVSSDDLLLSCRQPCTSPYLHMFPEDGRKNVHPATAVLLWSAIVCWQEHSSPHLAAQGSSLLLDLPPCVDQWNAGDMRCLSEVWWPGGTYRQVCSERNILASYPDISWLPFHQVNTSKPIILLKISTD